MSTDVSTEQTDLQREIVAHVNDLKRPIGQDDTRPSARAFYMTNAEEANKLDAVLRNTSWTHTRYDPVEEPVWLALARLLPNTGLVDPNKLGDPQTLAYHWAKARCVFAGAGYPMHATIATTLNRLYAHCDLDPTETETDWLTALQNAHQVCGWPVTLGLASWTHMRWSMDPQERGALPATWQRVFALLHILKHCRTRGNKLAIAHNGLSSLVPMGESNVIALSKKTKQMVLEALGCPSLGPKIENPLCAAVGAMLQVVSVDRLLSQRPLAELDGTVIAGPWSSTEPTPITGTSFFQTGLQLTGVWRASNGKVSEYTGDQHDAIDWAWNVTNPSEYNEIKHALMATMPATYPTSWPGDMLMADFPNLDIAWATDHDCAKVLLELPIFASLLRKAGEPLSREFPFVLFLPDRPTMEESTDQGKTAITRTVVRALAPGAPTVVPPDTSSAPDNRAFIDVLQQFGTAGLDEWAPPANRSHPLSHQNLQTLCTGGGITFGRVLENSGMMQLRHSLVAGCKSVEFPPDMVSRTFSWPLKRFTDQERNRPEVKARVDSGQASLQLRLAALYQIEMHGIAAKLASAKGSNTPSMRFDSHAQLAEILYELRTGKACTTLAKTLSEMRIRLAQHVNEAATSGVLSAQEHGGYLTIRLPDIFSGVGNDVLGLMAQEMATCSVATSKQLGNGWNTPAQMLECLRRARGFPSLQSMLPAMTGSKIKASDRQILLALSRSLRSLVSEHGVFQIPETDWTIERTHDMSNAVRIRLQPASLLQSNSGGNNTWALDK